jgi:hypothetical protein
MFKKIGAGGRLRLATGAMAGCLMACSGALAGWVDASAQPAFVTQLVGDDTAFIELMGAFIAVMVIATGLAIWIARSLAREPVVSTTEDTGPPEALFQGASGGHRARTSEGKRAPAVLSKNRVLRPTTSAR